MQNNDPVHFSRNLMKGRVTETLFEQMLRSEGRYTILAFGYENLLPELAQRQGDIHAKETMEIIRRAPDFAIVDHTSHEVRLVEVKYLANPTEKQVLADATRMRASWKSAYLFLATPEGFYFDKASDIVSQNGRISPLLESAVKKELQDKYISLLKEFIR